MPAERGAMRIGSTRWANLIADRTGGPVPHVDHET